MNAPIDLKKLEQKAWTSTYQDGLWDIYLGMLLFAIGLLSTFLNGIESRWIVYLIYFAALGGSWLLFWLGKRLITMPRLGRVKFGAERRRKKLHLTLVMGTFVVLNVLLIFFTVAANNNPATWGRFMPGGLAVPLFIAVYVGAAIAFIAYFNDFTRGYYVAGVFALTFGATEIFNNPIFYWIGGALVFIPGVALFVLFLRQHPLPPSEVTHDQP
jgi:hypothetical protein